VPTVTELRKLSKECRVADDDQRWLLALILDTGMRLSEAAGLLWNDIVLSGDVPYLHVRPNAIRRLKTISSERVIPLTGSSLWAVHRAQQQRNTRVVFPRYVADGRLNANSASAALNKWLQANIAPKLVVH
jgi:integrase